MKSIFKKITEGKKFKVIKQSMFKSTEGTRELFSDVEILSDEDIKNILNETNANVSLEDAKKSLSYIYELMESGVLKIKNSFKDYFKGIIEYINELSNNTNEKMLKDYTWFYRNMTNDKVRMFDDLGDIIKYTIYALSEDEAISYHDIVRYIEGLDNKQNELDSRQ